MDLYESYSTFRSACRYEALDCFRKNYPEYDDWWTTYCMGGELWNLKSFGLNFQVNGPVSFVEQSQDMETPLSWPITIGNGVMKNIEQAKQTSNIVQQVYNRAYLPIPFTFEDNSELTWMLWDEATIQLDFILGTEWFFRGINGTIGFSRIR